MKRITILAFTLSIILLPAAKAQEAWSLRKCIDYAIENNLTVRKAETVVSDNELDLNTAKWARLPNLNGSASQSFNWGRAASPVDNTYADVNNSNTSLNLSTNVPLFTGFQIPNQLQLSKLNLKASIEDLNKVKEDIAVNVSLFYVQVLYTMELNSVAREQVKLSREQLDRMTRLHEVGKASPAEVAEAKARVAQDEMNAVQADNNYGLALLDLSQMLELPSPEGFYIEVPDVEPDFKPITPPDDIYVGTVLTKSNIMAAQYRLEASEKIIRIAQSGYMPQLSFGAGLGSSYYTVNGNATNGFFKQLDNNLNKYIGFNLSIPIFNRFATRNRVRSARLQQTNYAIQLDEAKKLLYKEIQQAWYSAVAAEAKYNSSAVAVEANEESFNLVNEKFENGKATSVEYNEAKLNLRKAMSDRIQAKYEYIFRTKVLDFYKGIPIE
ncbi:TolC family protein [Bacteroides sp. OttesenSCG-928-J23]|nr:TolC family protein [Bacteroides sp. OttesenSCG-928-N06]MDL2247492.1 TolC family protein [Bacteroides sp. OttesenSCG-928-J23]MDL2304500.1 TolC family protein [Bacteroides sp. OttesenSCG-928-D19]